MKRLIKGKAKAAPVEAPIAAEEYPTLCEFFAAYLHQDFRNTYGSPTKAAKNYIADASPDEVQTLRNEWQGFRKKLDGQPLTVIQAAVRKLGAAWLPDSEAALTQLDGALK
jgi:CdiI immunity protein